MSFQHVGNVSTLTRQCKHVHTKLRPNCRMEPLKDRLDRLMRERNWAHADLMRVTGQSSSVVSQWLGKGSKEIKSIGSLEAALKLAEATGYNPLWIAEGRGPARPYVAPHLGDTGHGLPAREEAPAYSTHERVFSDLRHVLRSTPAPMRPAMASLLSTWALNGGHDDLIQALCALCSSKSTP